MFCATRRWVKRSSLAAKSEGSLGLATYREKKDASGLVIDLDRKAFESENVAFLVYVGDRVVLRDSEAWSVRHAAADSAQ